MHWFLLLVGSLICIHEYMCAGAHTLWNGIVEYQRLNLFYGNWVWREAWWEIEQKFQFNECSPWEKYNQIMMTTTCWTDPTIDKILLFAIKVVVVVVLLLIHSTRFTLSKFKCLLFETIFHSSNQLWLLVIDSETDILRDSVTYIVA